MFMLWQQGTMLRMPNAMPCRVPHRQPESRQKAVVSGKRQGNVHQQESLLPSHMAAEREVGKIYKRRRRSHADW